MLCHVLGYDDPRDLHWLTPSVPARRASDLRLQPIDARTMVEWHRVERRVLVRKFGIAAHGRDGDAEKACSRGRAVLKAPVAVPIFSEERRGFVGSPLDQIGRASCRERVCQYV